MKIQRYSYIRNFLGDRNYEKFKEYAQNFIPITTIILVASLVLSQFVHWGIVSWLLNSALGTSLVFIAYVLGVILLLDFSVDVDMEEDWNGRLSLPKVMPFNYKYTIIWAYTLIILGIAAIYFSDKYRKEYAFECQTFLVDKDRGIFHLEIRGKRCLEDYHDDEEVEYITMKGYELKEHDYTFCQSCKDWLEDLEMEAEGYLRR